jgi:hypothetical protein
MRLLGENPVSNPATAFAILIIAGLTGLSLTTASSEPSAAAVDGRCAPNSGQCAETRCQWFGDGCWNEAIYERVMSGEPRRSAHRETKLADVNVRKSDQATHMPPAVWVSFHIGGY